MKSRQLERLTNPALALLASLVLSACSQETPVLAIASGGSAGNYYSVARAIARVVNETGGVDGIKLKQETTSGSVANIDAILAGEANFGLAQADLEFQATNGLAIWKAKGPQTNLRAMFSLYPESITIVATSASGIRTTRDLIGKRVDIGHIESGGRQNAIDALEAAGIDWQNDIVIHEDNADERSAKYLRGDLDAYFTTAGHPTRDIEFAVNSVPGARLVPLSHFMQLFSMHPYYTRSTIPIALYPGIVNAVDVETAGVKTLFLTSAEVPDELVYLITKAVFENVESLGKFDPVLTTLDPAAMLEGMSAPLHPGALEYYKEVGLQP